MGKIKIDPKRTNVKIDKVWAELAKYGIYSEADLDEAMKTLEPIRIGCMVSPVADEILDKTVNETEEQGTPQF